MLITSGGKEFLKQPNPKGWFQAVLADVYDLGEVADTFAEGGKKKKFDIFFESARTMTREDFEEQDIEVDEDKIGKPFVYSKRYNLSIHPDSNFGKDLATWEVDNPYPKPFDPDTLIGRNAMLKVKKKESGWIGITAIFPLDEDKEPITVSSTYVRKQDRPSKDDTSFNHGANATAAPAGLG